MEQLDVMEALERKPDVLRKGAPGGKFIQSGRPDSPLFQIYSGLAIDLLDWGGAAEPGLPGKTVVVSSPAAGDGRSLTAVNLAVAAGSLGAKTLLVDADPVNASLAGLFGLGGQEGLAEAVIGKKDIAELVLDFPDAGISFLAAGGVAGVNPFTLFAGSGFAGLVQTLRDSYDLVVLDSAPIMTHSHVLSLVKASRDVLGVVRAERTKRHDVSRFIEAVRAADGELAGLVFNDDLDVIPRFIQRVI